MPRDPSPISFFGCRKVPTSLWEAVREPARARPRARSNNSAPLEGGGGRVPHYPPPPLKTLGQIFLRAFGRSRTSLALLAPIGLDQKFSSARSAPLQLSTTRGRRGGGGGGGARTLPPLKQSPGETEGANIALGGGLRTRSCQTPHQRVTVLWERPRVKHCRRRRGRDAKGGTSSTCAPLSQLFEPAPFTPLPPRAPGRLLNNEQPKEGGPLPQTDHRGTTRNSQSGKSGGAIFGTQNFGSQTPAPPFSLNIFSAHCSGCFTGWACALLCCGTPFSLCPSFVPMARSCNPHSPHTPAVSGSVSGSPLKKKDNETPHPQMEDALLKRGTRTSA